MAITIETLKKIGGKEWQKGDHHRIYFNNLTGWYGLETTHYNTGNISSATLDGERISNGRARKIEGRLSYGKLYYNVKDGKFYYNGLDRDDFDTLIARIKARAAEVNA